MTSFAETTRAVPKGPVEFFSLPPLCGPLDPPKVELVLIQFDRLRAEIYMWIPDHRVVYLPALVKDVEEMLALMQGKKRLQVRDSNQHGGGGLYVEDIPRFVDNESLIPPLARTKSQAPGKHSLRSKSMPIKDRTFQCSSVTPFSCLPHAAVRRLSQMKP